MDKRSPPASYTLSILPSVQVSYRWFLLGVLPCCCCPCLTEWPPSLPQLLGIVYWAGSSYSGAGSLLKLHYRIRSKKCTVVVTEKYARRGSGEITFNCGANCGNNPWPPRAWTLCALLSFVTTCPITHLSNGGPRTDLLVEDREHDVFKLWKLRTLYSLYWYCI